MKNRKLVALVCAALLSLSVAATATAATVPGEVYGTGAKKAAAQIQADLAKAGIKDVPADHWAAGSITILVEAGLVAPDANGQINPDAPMSYTNTVAVFAKVLGIASKTDTPEQATAKAAQAGLGAAPDANGNVSRLQIAKLLATALGIKPATENTLAFKDTLGLSTADNALLLALKQHGIFLGYEDGSFRPNDTLTTAQVAILIDRILGAQGK